MLRSKLPGPGLHKNTRQRGMNEFAFIKSCLSQQKVLGDSGVVFFFHAAYQCTNTCVLGKLGIHICSGRMLVWLRSVIPLKLVQRKQIGSLVGAGRGWHPCSYSPHKQKPSGMGVPLPDSGRWGLDPILSQGFQWSVTLESPSPTVTDATCIYLGFLTSQAPY